jgi:hypothetical protein
MKGVSGGIIQREGRRLLMAFRGSGAASPELIDHAINALG